MSVDTNRLYFAGVDLGSSTFKIVVCGDSEIVFRHIEPVNFRNPPTSIGMFNEILALGSLSVQDLAYVVGSGYGRSVMQYVAEHRSDVFCHAKGARQLVPGARFVIDLGGQDFKLIALDAAGRITDFILNDMCAGGTGYAIESVADLFQVSLEEFVRLGLEAKKQLQFSTTCAVFARSEALNMLARGERKENIIAGYCDAVASQISILAGKISVEKDVVVTGGVAKNTVVIKRLEARLGLSLVVPAGAELAGALGAATCARERFIRKTGKGP